MIRVDPPLIVRATLAPVRPTTKLTLEELRAAEAATRMTPEQVAAWWAWFYRWPEEGGVADPKARAEAERRKKP